MGRRRLRLGGRRANGERSCRAPGGGRAELPRHNCGVSDTSRVASDANLRTDTHRRAKKNLDTRVPVNTTLINFQNYLSNIIVHIT